MADEFKRLDRELVYKGSIIDFYNKYEYSSQKFLSPILKSGNYTLSIEVLGEHPAWSDKRKADYGSTDNYVMIEDVYTID